MSVSMPLIFGIIFSLCIVLALLFYSRLRLRKKELVNTLLEKRLGQQELILAILRSFISSEASGTLLHNAIMMFALSMKLSRVMLASLDRETNVIAFDHEWTDPKQNLKAASPEGKPFAPGEILYDTFIALGDVHLVCNNIEENPALAQGLEGLGIKSFACVPILISGQFWGALGIAQCDAARIWDEADVRLLKLASDAIATLLIRVQTEHELVKAKEEALQAKTRAELSSESKSNFLARMSHEMRTPMNAIIGMTAIAKGSSDRGKIENYLDKINEASAHLLGVINDILDMSKIELGKLDITYLEFDFGKMIKKVTSMLDFRINEKEQKFILDIDKHIPERIISDEQRLMHVLLNLLFNAIKFTPEGGSITFTAKADNVTHNKLILRFNVIDTGIGISASNMEMLFDSFEQVDGGVSRKYGGTGIGLAISKSIIELMSGKIWVESEPGKGSNFAFEIPVETGAGQAESAEGKASPMYTSENNVKGIFAGKTILLAEDVEINREIVAALLEDTGVQVDCAGNGIEVLRLYRENPSKYSVILMDIHMPEVDGYEATRRVRALEAEMRKEEGIPIIAMTANVFKEDIQRCIDSGMNAHLGKPIDIIDLVAILKKYFYV